MSDDRIEGYGWDPVCVYSISNIYGTCRCSLLDATIPVNCKRGLQGCEAVWDKFSRTYQHSPKEGSSTNVNLD